LLLALALAACGRSSMLDTAAPDAAPDVDPCARLVRDGEHFTSPGADYGALVPLRDDGSQVALVHNGSGEARSLAPWGAWPPVISAPITACTGCSGSFFAVAPASPGAQPGFALATFDVVHHEDAVPDHPPVLFPAVPSAAAPVPLPMGAWDTPQLARGAGGHLVTTWRTDAEGKRWADLAYLPFGAAAPEQLGDVGCGWTPLVAVPGGFLLAGRSSLGDGPDACGESAVLSIVHLDEASRAVTRLPLPESTALDDPAWGGPDLLLVAGAGGAWLLAQPSNYKGEGGFGPVLVLRLRADGTPEGGWKEIPLDEEDVLWGTAVLGGRLIVITLGQGTEGRALRFTMVGEDGQPRRVHEENFSYAVWTRSAPVASPDGTRLLMAVSGGLLRLSCAAEER
jgi:hypothetical protein